MDIIMTRSRLRIIGLYTYLHLLSVSTDQVRTQVSHFKASSLAPVSYVYRSVVCMSCIYMYIQSDQNFMKQYFWELHKFLM